MIEPRSVVHFSIAVSDLEASRKFYAEILGLTLVQASPTTGMVFLRAGHDHVILAKSDVPLQRDARDSRRAHHAFKVDPAYCLICECYPESAVGADDPTSANRLSLSAIEARSTARTVGGSGP